MNPAKASGLLALPLVLRESQAQSRQGREGRAQLLPVCQPFIAYTLPHMCHVPCWRLANEVPWLWSIVLSWGPSHSLRGYDFWRVNLHLYDGLASLRSVSGNDPYSSFSAIRGSCPPPMLLDSHEPQMPQSFSFCGHIFSSLTSGPGWAGNLLNGE